MRRVYYSYGVSILSQAVFWQGMFLGVASLLLAKWLFVASIINNFLAVPVGHAPRYALDALVGAVNHGEVLTAVVFVLAGVVTMSCGYRLAQALLPLTRITRTMSRA